LVIPSGAIRYSIETDMANRESLRRTTRDLVALSHSDLDFVALREQAAERLRRALPFDSYCWLTLDPASLLPTSCVADHSLDYLPRALENELFDDDFNKLRSLASSACHVGALGQLTQGDPSRSRRYRELLAPMGLRGELRAALVVDGSCWGFLALQRVPSHPDFDLEEVAF